MQRLSARITSILEHENIEIKKETLLNILKKSFPDFRKIWQAIQYYTITGIDISDKLDESTELYNLVMSKETPIKIWDYLEVNWMDNIEDAFHIMGRGFFNWIKKKHPDKEVKLPEYVSILSEYSDVRFLNALDPFVTLNAFIFKTNKLFTS